MASVEEMEGAMMAKRISKAMDDWRAYNRKRFMRPDGERWIRDSVNPQSHTDAKGPIDHDQGPR